MLLVCHHGGVIRSAASAQGSILHRAASRCLWRRGECLSTLPGVATASAHYDLVVVGSGPAAVKCAVTSAKLGKRIAVVDKKGLVGGVCVHTGTIPSKTFREAVLHLTGYRHQGFYGRSYSPAKSISMPDLLSRVRKVEGAETDVVTDQLSREGVEIITGTARFIERKSGDAALSAMVLRSTDIYEAESSPYRHVEANAPKTTISADRFLIACGTRPVRPAHVPFDGKHVFDSDQLLWGAVEHIPRYQRANVLRVLRPSRPELSPDEFQRRDLIVVGAGVIGMEYACMINVIPGTTVTVVDPRPDVLPFADSDAIENLQYSMRQNGARFLLNDKVMKVDKVEGRERGGGTRVVAHLHSGKRVVGDALLYTMGRQGNTDSLNLEKVGLEPDARGLLQVNDYYQTSNRNVYACGDVIGYPALASTSMEQGRRAALHMWGHRPRLDDDETDISDDEGAVEEHDRVKSVAEGGFLGRISEQLFPYGIYTIPEVSMIGKTEAQLTKEGVPYEVGIADYQELAKGQMLGGADGFLKLIFHAETLRLLGVHCIGEGATEIIHIGQVVMSQGGTIKYFETAVFNFPTLAEAYNVAAADGLRKVTALDLL